jgi:hypothetical protein
VSASVAAPFERLDFVYMPSRDVGSDMDAPRVMLADHLSGDRPVLVYRVGDLDVALDDLEARGWKREQSFEIPYGPCCSFRTPGGQRIALYEMSRPDVHEHFAGRRDF